MIYFQVHFHFQTRKTDEENTLVDDSRLIGSKEPMVLVLGKKFKLEAWEAIVKKMAVNEVAKFSVDKSVCRLYSICLIKLKKNYFFL